MWFALIGLAFAQDGPTTVPSGLLTWQDNMLDQIVETNARIYGSAGLLERRVFPSLAKVESDETGVFIFMESETLYRAFAVPQGDCLGPVGQSSDKWETPGYCLRDVDMFSSTGGIAVGNQNIGAFYVAGWTGLMSPDVGLTRPIWPIPAFGLSYFMLPTAWLYTGPTKVMDGLDTITGNSRADYMLGVRGGYGGVAAHVGFLGSSTESGFFTNLSEDTLGLMANAVVQGSLEKIPYLKVGRPVARLAGEVPAEPIVFVRKLNLDVPSTIADPLAGVPQGDADGIPGEGNPPSLWSGHAGAASDNIDIRLGVAWQPKPILHEVAVLAHSPGWAASDPDEREEWEAAVGLGMVQMPAMPWYGLEQQATPYFDIEADYRGFRAIMGYNHADTLAYFPMARNSFRVGLQYTYLQGGF